MSKSHYAYRIWQVIPGKAGKPPVLASVNPELSPWWELSSQPKRWETKTLVATCWKKSNHRAPQPQCTCGIYAYPDWLDALRLIDDYCANGTYALGLVSGYGRPNNDGTVVVQDACMRFAEADIVALAEMGSGWRAGLVDQIAGRLEVPVMSVPELQTLAATGAQVTRKQHRPPDARYLDEIPTGQQVTVAPSALVADQDGRLFLRNDREAQLPDPRYDDDRFFVTRLGVGSFSVTSNACLDERFNFLTLPFDGRAALSQEYARLAGRIGYIDLANGSMSRFKASATDPGTVKAPAWNRSVLIDLLVPNQRIEVTGSSMNIDRSGEVWLKRTLLLEDQPLSPRFFVTRIDTRSYAVEIQVGPGETDIASVSRIPKRVTAAFDTRASQVSLNDEVLTDGRIPEDWIYGGLVVIPAEVV